VEKTQAATFATLTQMKSMDAMPRRLKLNDQQANFVKENAHKGAIWLAEQLQVNRAALYQWGYDNKISVKRRDYPVRYRTVITSQKWPRKYMKYKASLIKRDGLNCHYCNQLMDYEDAQIDHVVPRVRGGTDAPINLVLACPICNHIKATLCYSCPDFRNAIEKVAVNE
jgi:5-methylcytosine-specific restriction endonuclease McrA